MGTALLFWSRAAWAHSSTGTLTGIITDPSNANLPGISLALTNAETGVTDRALSHPQGEFATRRFEPSASVCIGQLSRKSPSSECLSAEYGNSTTRSGTNEFRGAAYEFFRNHKLEARSLFRGEEGVVCAGIFSGSPAGGPI